MIKRTEELKGYLSSKDAGSSLGYTHDYISRLCRQNKIAGIQRGREWFVLLGELEDFKKRHEIELQEKKKELSKKFSKIRLEFEANKRKSKENAKIPQEEVKREILNNESKKSIKFFIPSQFVAVAVLALVLFIPTFIKNISKENFVFSNQIPTSSISVTDFSGNISQGIQDTIYMQATVIPKVANIFAFSEYLADGYWQYFNVLGELPYRTYVSLKNIGNVYLAAYVLQGEAICQSAQNLPNIGNFVLKGYKLVGECFVVGSSDILNKYATILNIEEQSNVAGININAFSANVSGGYKYASESISSNILDIFVQKVAYSFGFISFNIGRNLSEIGSTFSQISSSTTAYVGTLFDFDLVNKQPKIRKLP